MPRVFPPLISNSSEHQQPPATPQHHLSHANHTLALSPSLIESVAGFTAGVVSTLAVHPFDIVKTRLQIEQNERSRAGGSLRVMRRIAQEARTLAPMANGTSTTTAAAVLPRQKLASSAAVVQAFYRGLMPNMIGNSVSWALYFMFYGKLKDVIRTHRPTHSTSDPRSLRSTDYFLASGLAGILTALLTNPIWVIKTRMLSSARSAPGAYKNIWHGTHTLYAAEGLRGFYRGLVPSLLGVSHGAIQFVAYEQLKNRFGSSRAGGKPALTNADFLYLSAASKVFAGSLTYPYQVVRARLQTYEAGVKYEGAWDVVRQVWRREGLGGFYKGVVPNVVRVLPSTCVTFLVYENVKFYFPRAWGGVVGDG